MEPAVRTTDLSRAFAGVTALQGLTMEIPQGIVFGLLGPNGSGKTTTIRLLLGLLRPTAGSAYVLGVDVQSRPAQVRQRCGALLEHSGLYERLDAVDNLELYGRFWGMPRGDRRARSRELLMNLGLWDRRHEPVGAWSRGMKQKLAIARALFHRPSLAFLDEPTAGLDPIAAATLIGDLTRLVREHGMTVFLTTHNLDEAERLCALVAVLRKGALVALGRPSDLGQQRRRSLLEITGSSFPPSAVAGVSALPGVKTVQSHGNVLQVHLDEAVDQAEVIATLVRHGARIQAVKGNTESLERTFRTLLEEVP